MREFSKIVLDVEMVYEGGANPRDRIEANVYEIGAPLAARLPFHHEMAYVSKSTQLISFVCADALPDRGATYVSDGVASTDAILATELGQKLKAHGVCYHRSLTDAENFVGEIGYGVYNHWQKSFGTDDPRHRRSQGDRARSPGRVGPESPHEDAVLQPGVRVLRTTRSQSALRQPRRSRHVVRHVARSCNIFHLPSARST